MPSSSRSKSHKKIKHSSKEYSDVDDDVKMKERNASNGDKENGVSIRVSKDSSVSGGKRKHGNDNLPEEYATPTKRRKEKTNGVEEKGNRGEKRHKENKEHNEWHVEEGVRNIELEKELEKRMKRRGEGYKNKDRYHDDVKEDNDRILSTNSCHVKGIKHKDEEHGDRYRESRHREDKGKENGERVSKSKDVKYKGEREKDNKHKDDKYYEDSIKDDKYHDDSDRDGKQRDKKYKESGGRVERNGDNKYRDKNGRAREDSDREKRTRDHKNGDQVVRRRDNKDRSIDIDKDEGTDYRTCNIKDQNCESEKGSMSDVKVDPISVNHNRHRSSPIGKHYPTRDHHRVSKQEETKSRDYNGNSNKDFTSVNGQPDKISSRSPEKITQKDGNCTNDNNFSQLDNDNLSVSSPFTRNNRFSINYKSFHPPQTPIRTQSNWQNFPNWPSPLPNSNYIPFPPIFNPFMHQFAPPIFHHPPIYHASVPPLLHNWGANNPISGNGSHGYGNGRVDRENSKIQSNNQAWEDTGVTVDMRSPVQKDEFLSEQTDIQVETMNNIPEFMKVKKEDDSLICRVYISKIDISEDLTESDLYNQCTRMLDLDQEPVSDEFDCKILFLEEGIEGHVSDGASLFDAINSSVFKKAMSLYTKQRARNQEKVGEDGDSRVKDSGVDGELSTSEKMDMDVDAGVKDSGHNCDGGKEVNKAADGGGSLLVVTTKPVMPELIEFESVNSSRIH